MACIGNASAIGFILFPNSTTPAHSRYNPKALSDSISPAPIRVHCCFQKPLLPGFNVGSTLRWTYNSARLRLCNTQSSFRKPLAQAPSACRFNWRAKSLLKLAKSSNNRLHNVFLIVPAALNQGSFGIGRHRVLLFYGLLTQPHFVNWRVGIRQIYDFHQRTVGA